MELTAYYLDFNAPLHIGREGIGQESVETTVRSDTLWGAMVQCWLLLYDDQPEKLCAQSPFRVSSCFPFFAGQAYFPLPIGALDILMQAEKDISRMKGIKKIAYLSYALFCRVLQGETLTAADLAPEHSCWPPFSDEKDTEKSRSDLHCHADKMEDGFFKTSQRPRLEIDRLYGGAREGQFFYWLFPRFPIRENNINPTYSELRTIITVYENLQESVQEYQRLQLRGKSYP